MKILSFTLQMYIFYHEIIFYFDMVPEEYEVRDGAPEFTGRICVIGSKLAEDKLAELFGL